MFVPINYISLYCFVDKWIRLCLKHNEIMLRNYFILYFSLDFAKSLFENAQKMCYKSFLTLWSCKCSFSKNKTTTCSCPYLAADRWCKISHPLKDSSIARLWATAQCLTRSTLADLHSISAATVTKDTSVTHEVENHLAWRYYSIWQRVVFGLQQRLGMYQTNGTGGVLRKVCEQPLHLVDCTPSSFFLVLSISQGREFKYTEENGPQMWLSKLYNEFITNL